jgi:hypothetical protein
MNSRFSTFNLLSGGAADASGATAGRARPSHAAESPTPTSDVGGGQRRSPTEQELREAQTKAAVCDAFLRLRREGYSLRMAATALGRPASFFAGTHSMLTRYQRGGVANLAPARSAVAALYKPDSLSARIEALGWFLPAARFYYLLTNRTWKSGSVPEAVRRTISLPHTPFGWTQRDKDRLVKAIAKNQPAHATQMDSIGLPSCPEDLREEILGREHNGLPLVTERIARQITVSAAVIRAYRHPTNFALEYLNAPGGMRLFFDAATGERRLARALEIVEGDDATINFPVCVPWTCGGSPCADKFGVMVGRFQWLVFIDVGTSYTLGFGYTARPRSSYRGEDVLSSMRIVCRQHGIPDRWRFERGVWKSKLVSGAVEGMGSHLETVYSPHQKPFIEGLFNVLWTKLSVHFPRAHVGRFQGEHETANDLLVACQRGHKDPRRYFPMLAQVIGAFQEAIAEKNRTPVTTESHGRWVPVERFEAETAARRPRRLDPATDWIFSPIVREWTVKGMLVGGRLPMFEGLNVPFDFSAPWLSNYSGARVKCFFDPAEPQCRATLCLAESWQGRKAGSELGRADLISSAAGYTRLVMGWGDELDTAGARKRQQAAAVRREIRAIAPAGRGASNSEERDGLGAVSRVEAADRDLQLASPMERPIAILEAARTARRERLLDLLDL